MPVDAKQVKGTGSDYVLSSVAEAECAKNHSTASAWGERVLEDALMVAFCSCICWEKCLKMSH